MGANVKEFKTYDDQVRLLESRGMDMGDHTAAADTLRRVNYYRLSGYWYPFRELVGASRQDKFYPGTQFSDVVALYEFDARLRAATFAALMPIELNLRALLGHELGRIDPCAHLDPALLGPTARRGVQYHRWERKYQEELSRSREDFVDHHASKYGGRLPVWAAVELLDWGSLTFLYGFAPRSVQDTIAITCGLTAPQLSSWLKALNVVRNICAHHGRFFNRVHTISPKMPHQGSHPDLDAIGADWSRTFGLLSLVQFLADQLGSGRSRLLPAAVKSFPAAKAVPITHMGVAPAALSASRLWA